VARPRAGVVLLNRNGWADTVECAESVLRSRGIEVRLIICDNGSDDGSPERIAGWARGEVPAAAASPAFRSIVEPPVPKPIPLEERTRREVLAGSSGSTPAAPLVLIRNGENRGFAAGNNPGIRFALDRGCDLVWLLNNDTVVDPDALAAMADELSRCPEAGMCGSVLLRYRDPGRVQALGGSRFNRVLGTTRPVGGGLPLDEALAAASAGRLGAPDYICGASLLLTRRLLEDVGLLSEDFFLYFEEVDLAERARGRYRSVWSPRSRVWHKEGSTAGSSADVRRKAPAADFWSFRSRLAFFRKHLPRRLPLVRALGLAYAGHRLLRGRPANAAAILRSLFARSL